MSLRDSKILLSACTQPELGGLYSCNAAVMALCVSILVALLFHRNSICKFLLLLQLRNQPRPRNPDRMREREAELAELEDMQNNGVQMQPLVRRNSMRENFRSHPPPYESHSLQSLGASGSGHDDQAPYLIASTTTTTTSLLIL